MRRVGNALYYRFRRCRIFRRRLCVIFGIRFYARAVFCLCLCRFCYGAQEFAGLIKPAPSFAVGVQRHRQNTIGLRQRRQKPRQCRGELPAAAKLEPPQQYVKRKSVGIQRQSGVKMRRGFQAFAAGHIISRHFGGALTALILAPEFDNIAKAQSAQTPPGRAAQHTSPRQWRQRRQCPDAKTRHPARRTM